MSHPVRLFGSHSLQLQAVQPATSQGYRSAFERFETYVFRVLGVQLRSVNCPILMDEYLNQYLLAVYEEFDGAMMHLGVRAIPGVLQEMGFQWNSAFPNSRRTLKGWEKKHPPKSALPLPASYVDLAALVLVLSGAPRVGAGLLIAFEGFLRVSELCALTSSDILLPSSLLSTTTTCGLRLGRTKTGRNQFVFISDPTVIQLLHQLHASTAPNSKLFPGMTPSKFNAALKWATRVLGITEHYTMHSLRHGRATAAFLAHVHPDVIRRAGRWSSLHSMETYLQGVTAFLLQTTTPPPLIPLLKLHTTVHKLLPMFCRG